MPLKNGHSTGSLYRALDLVHAREPLSGRGRARSGGRFNPRAPLRRWDARCQAGVGHQLQKIVEALECTDLGPHRPRDNKPNTAHRLKGRTRPLRGSRSAEVPRSVPSGAPPLLQHTPWH
ncbi:hypothetical protein CYR75_15005 (plasmid) [Paracoccus jeotgali]|uniref:Uncharacterized protein n=1 Tax=Paracoccus jeotgali TaxID=2065379 RepID=A0A2K9MJT0_9RHOB|nr:hypothetical protein CYR75_15005 [Paracoccus jeotgali]